MLVDGDSRQSPDVFRCGPGIDEVDKAADDCEHLHPYRY